ncbi:MAG: deoxyribonuclease IV [Armatimonadota bacterium]
MPATLIGAHMPTSGGLPAAIRDGKDIGCTTVQVFTSSPRQWASKPVTDEMAASLQAALKETEIGDHVVSHDTYLINLSAPDLEIRRKSLEALTREMNRCGKLGIPYVVSHMGAHAGQGVSEGLKLVAEGAKEVLANSPSNVTLLMETTAGQGSSLNARFEEIAEVFDLTGSPSNLAICLDTCHIFAAGYNLVTPDAYTKTFEEFERLIGVHRIKVVHVNDSQKGLGTRVDRHAHLGEGMIGETAFRCLVHDSRFENVPLVVETPDAETHHKINVERLWKWCSEPDPRV